MNRPEDALCSEFLPNPCSKSKTFLTLSSSKDGNGKRGGCRAAVRLVNFGYISLKIKNLTKVSISIDPPEVNYFSEAMSFTALC